MGIGAGADATRREPDVDDADVWKVLRGEVDKPQLQTVAELLPCLGKSLLAQVVPTIQYILPHIGEHVDFAAVFAAGGEHRACCGDGFGDAAAPLILPHRPAGLIGHGLRVSRERRDDRGVGAGLDVCHAVMGARR